MSAHIYCWLFLRFRGLQPRSRRNSFQSRHLPEEAAEGGIQPQLSGIQGFMVILGQPTPRNTG